MLAEDIKLALQAAKLLEKFQNLPPSHQREYLNWINEAKKPNTRAARITKMLEMLKDKFT